MVLGSVFLSLSIAIQTASFQNYITNKLIEDINENELINNEYKLEISDVSIAMNGKLVLNSVIFVNLKSDTIVSLDKVQSSLFPFFQKNKEFKNLIIDGLKIDAGILDNINNESKNASSLNVNQLSNSIGLESLIINDSDINFNLNNQLYKIDKLNLRFQDISIKNNSVSLYIDELSGLINESINIEDFESDIIINNQSINVLAYRLTIEDNLLTGDLKIDVDDDLNINNVEGVLNESIVNLNDFQNIPESLKEIKTSFNFSGDQENIEIKSFQIDSDDFIFNGNGIIEDYNDLKELSVNLKVNEFNSSLNNLISIDSTSQSLEIIDNLFFQGIIGFKENKLIFDLNHNDDLNQSVHLLGDINFNEKVNFQVDITTDFNHNSDLISNNSFDDIKSNINIRGNIGEINNIDSFGGNIIIDNKSKIDFTGYIKNNYISSDFNIINNESTIGLKFNGNIEQGVYEISSEVSNINSNNIINSNSTSIISFKK